ncbi:MAG TPA: hypothetical protein VJC07_01930 [Candidatus Nanoarchaeia archaeon]|nr:hypothetical protein [Candidatus Nanoarchaeia archaeon]
MGIFFGNAKEKPLEERINEIISKDEKVKYLIEKNPGLRDYLMESYRQAYEKGRGLSGFAKFIDYVRKPLGWIKLVGSWLGPGKGYLVRGLARVGELALFALPYSVYYGSKGGNMKEVGKIVGTEVGKLFAPYGDAANFIPVYSNAAKKYVENTAKKYFMEAIQQKGLDVKGIYTGKNLEEVLKEQPLPGETSSRSKPIDTLPRRSQITRARERV